jgi:hypothetical protein
MSDAEPDDGSLKSYITGQMREKRAASIERLPIPRFPRLILRCRTPSDRERLELACGIERADKDGEIPALIEGSAKLLVNTCEGIETDRGEDIGCRLGVELATYLGPELCGVPHDDLEAALGVFQSEADIVESAGELQNRSGETNMRIEREIVGNSEAAG